MRGTKMGLPFLPSLRASKVGQTRMGMVKLSSQHSYIHSYLIPINFGKLRQLRVCVQQASRQAGNKMSAHPKHIHGSRLEQRKKNIVAFSIAIIGVCAVHCRQNCFRKIPGPFCRDCVLWVTIEISTLPLPHAIRNQQKQKPIDIHFSRIRVITPTLLLNN